MIRLSKLETEKCTSGSSLSISLVPLVPALAQALVLDPFNIYLCDGNIIPLSLV